LERGRKFKFLGKLSLIPVNGVVILSSKGQRSKTLGTKM